jgi:thioredoxin-like negative regulator of GroEL
VSTILACPDENQQLAARFEAMSIALLLIVRDGQGVERVVRAVPKARLEQRLAAQPL